MGKHQRELLEGELDYMVGRNGESKPAYKATHLVTQDEVRLLCLFFFILFIFRSQLINIFA